MTTPEEEIARLHKVVAERDRLLAEAIAQRDLARQVACDLARITKPTEHEHWGRWYKLTEATKGWRLRSVFGG